jgi:hypothetical protein
MPIGFCAGTKVFEEALNEVKFLGWLKKFGSAQNILGPVKGQDNSVLVKALALIFGLTNNIMKECFKILL